MHCGYLVHTRDPIVIEIRLLHHAILDSDPLGQGNTQAINDAALGLSHNIVWLDGDAAIDRAPEVMHADLSARTIERNFGNARRLRSGIVDVGKAKRAALARALPVGHLRHPLDNLSGTRILAEHIQPELQRIDAALGCEFVHERFRRKLVGDKPDATERRGADAGVLIELFDKLIGHVIAR